MLSGDFFRKLQKLNNHLRVYCGDDANRAAQLFIDKRWELGELEDVCGVDKSWTPEWPIYNEDGTIYKSGWRRVLRILLAKRLVDRSRADSVFQCHLNESPKVGPRYTKKEQRIAELVRRGDWQADLSKIGE